ncbi:hypothetical protein MKX01_030978 [Papaver californicum]|nr:hypothetical protein MKX01_030978 [Papaver californicum]
MATTPTSPTPDSSSILIDSNSSFGGSQRLRILAQQLRLYKPPPPHTENDEIDEKKREESGGKVVSQLGFAQSATPIADPERFTCKKAAVLVCLFEDNVGDLRVILTKSSTRLSSHSGEVALPGGKADEGEANDEETATREANEEIGLDPSPVHIVTVLEPFLSKDENQTSEEREWLGDKYLIHFFDYKAENKEFVIWGITAGILIRAASVVYDRPPSFVEQRPKLWVPEFVKKGTTMT